jgi:hypothetical protein
MGLSFSIAFVFPRHRDFSGVLSWAKPKWGVAFELPDLDVTRNRIAALFLAASRRPATLLPMGWAETIRRRRQLSAEARKRIPRGRVRRVTQARGQG